MNRRKRIWIQGNTKKQNQHFQNKSVEIKYYNTLYQIISFLQKEVISLYMRSENLLIQKNVEKFLKLYQKMYSLENFKLTKPDFTTAVHKLKSFYITQHKSGKLQIKDLTEEKIEQLKMNNEKQLKVTRH